MRASSDLEREPATEAAGFVVCEAPFAGCKVHVEGWGRGCVVVFQGFDMGEAVLRTPKTGKEYRTRNRLLLTRRRKKKL